MTDRVYWVGAIDWGIRDFHGYATSRGTTYNAYLVMADKVTLVDTVKAAFCDEMMARIASVVEPRKIEVVISNHSEMDHTGCLPRTIEAVRPEAVYASPNGVKALGRHFGMGTDVLTEVKDGQTVSLGNMSVRFLETRMLHWPDSMVSYLPEEQVLFSQDGFGQHLASTERFADEIAPDVLRYEAAKYYANILLPFSPLVAKLLARLHELNLPLKLLAPDHGPAYRKDFGWILDLWGRWAEQRPARKAVVAYDTMWGSTAIMAGAVTEGLLEGGAGSVKVMPLVASQRSDVATELLEAGALVLGSPTLNNNLFPTLADLVAYLEGLRPKNLVGAAFGSYGWSGEGVARLEAGLKAIGVDRVAESLKVQYVPTIADLERCRNLGRTVGEALAARCAGGGA
jgi:flavorubredoxin